MKKISLFLICTLLTFNISGMDKQKKLELELKLENKIKQDLFDPGNWVSNYIDPENKMFKKVITIGCSCSYRSDCNCSCSYQSKYITNINYNKKNELIRIKILSNIKNETKGKKIILRYNDINDCDITNFEYSTNLFKKSIQCFIMLDNKYSGITNNIFMNALGKMQSCNKLILKSKNDSSTILFHNPKPKETSYKNLKTIHLLQKTTPINKKTKTYYNMLQNFATLGGLEHLILEGFYGSKTPIKPLKSYFKAINKIKTLKTLELINTDLDLKELSTNVKNIKHLILIGYNESDENDEKEKILSLQKMLNLKKLTLRLIPINSLAYDLISITNQKEYNLYNDDNNIQNIKYSHVSNDTTFEAFKNLITQLRKKNITVVAPFFDFINDKKIPEKEKLILTHALVQRYENSQELVYYDKVNYKGYKHFPGINISNSFFDVNTIHSLLKKSGSTKVLKDSSNLTNYKNQLKNYNLQSYPIFKKGNPWKNYSDILLQAH